MIQILLENYIVYFQYTNIKNNDDKKQKEQRRAIVYTSPNWICRHPDLNSTGKSVWQQSGDPPGKRPQAVCPLCG